MTRRMIIFGIFLLIGFSAKSQLYSYGIKAGLNYSVYHLSNQYVFYQTDASSLAYHVGVYGRRNLGKFFIQADLNMTSGLKGKITFRRNQYEFSKSSISIPLLIGRSFYPGSLRVYTGVVPGFYFGKDNIYNFLQNQHLIAPGSYGSSPGIGYLMGSGIDFSRFTVDIRFEGNLLGGFYSEQRNPDIQTFHRFSHILMSLGYKLQ